MNRPRRGQKETAIPPVPTNTERNVLVSVNETQAGKKKRTKTTADSLPLDKRPSAPKKAKKSGVASPQDEAGGAQSNATDVLPPPAAVNDATANIDAPAKPPRKPRRGKEEMAAVRAEAALKKKQKEDLAKEKEQKIAELNRKEDADRIAEDARTIRRLRDIEASDGGEDFRVEIDNVATSTSEESDEAIDMESLKKKFMTLQQENKMLKSGKNQDLVGKGKKKAPTEKIPASNFASGLRADWGANLNLPSQETKSTPTTKNQGAAPAAKSHGGGFEDSDVEDVNPYKEVTNEERDAMDVNVDVVMNDAGKMKDVESRMRQNKLVSIVEVDDSDDDKKEFIPIIAQRHTVPAYPRKPRTVASSAQATNQLKPQNDINKVKTSGKKKSSTPAPAVVGLPGKEPEKTVKRFSSNSVRTSDLPKFAINEWRSVFLPTLYDKLFALDEPFASFFKGSQDFVSLLQLTVNEVYPFSDYQVASYDALHALAYNRINEKRSIIGSNAVQIIKSYVTRFQGEAEIMAWGRWALRTDGPLFYRVPAPANSPVDHKDPEYEPPQGRLLSQFVINLAGPFLKQTKGSQVFKSIHPQGLLALVFAALERAVKSILKPNDTLKEFSNEFWGSKVKSYQTSLRAITDARWKELFEACGVRALDDADEDLDVNMSLLDNNRALMFDFASPVRM